MSPIIKKIKGTYLLITPTDDKDEEEEIELVVDKHSLEWDFATEINKFEFGDAIRPSAIEFDFKSKKITVQF